MIGQHHVGAVGDEQAPGDLDALRGELLEFAEERLRIEHDAVADDALRTRVQDAGRNLVQDELAIADHDRVAGVGAALVAHHEVGLLGQHVDQLALALVAPLRADDHDTVVLAIEHQLPSRPALMPCGKSSALPSLAAFSIALRSTLASAPEAIASRMAGVDLEPLHDRLAPAALALGHQPLRDHAAQRVGQPHAADLALLRQHRRDQLEHGARRVERRHGGEHQAVGFGGADGAVDRHRFAQLAEDDHVGILPARSPQAGGHVVGVGADLALGDRARKIAVQVLDRILERDDVPLLAAIDVVHHRRDRRRLAGATRAGHQHQPVRRLGELRHHVGQAEPLGRRHRERNHPQHHHERRALPQHVDPEPADAGHAPRAIEVAQRFEPRIVGRHARRTSPPARASAAASAAAW